MIVEHAFAQAIDAKTNKRLIEALVEFSDHFSQTVGWIAVAVGRQSDVHTPLPFRGLKRF